MNDDVIMSVDRLSKKFARSLKRAMMYGLTDIARAALVPHRFRSEGLEARLRDEPRERGTSVTRAPLDATGLRPSEFWALRNVSFDVRRGECLGIVGHNGAGKSTLFSIMSGIYGPTEGCVTVRGRLQALIALGAGFHPTLSGRENIYLSASIYGLTGREIDAVYEQIVDFADLGEFIEMPIKKYSSGMLVRLGFATAIHLKPDALIVDEVLAVGDHAFKLKCNQRMTSIIQSGIPILFVSHMTQAVEAIATRVMWMDHGRVVKIGAPREIIEEYTAFMDEKAAEAKSAQSGFAESDSPISIHRVEIHSRDGRENNSLRWKDPITVRMHYRCKELLETPYFVVRLIKIGENGGLVSIASMSADSHSWQCHPGEGYVDCTFGSPCLTHGQYDVWCSIARSATISTGLGPYQQSFRACGFRVAASPEEMSLPGIQLSLRGDLPAIVLPHKWTCR